MTKSTHRIIVAEDAYADHAVPLALAYANKIAETEGIGEPDIVLLTHTKAQLRSGAIASALGSRFAKALADNKRVNLETGGTIRNETMKTMSQFSSGKIIIVAYAEDRILDFADGIDHPAGIIAIPDLAGSANSWKERWNPLVHGEKRGEAVAIVEDKVTVSALKTLSKVINLSTGLSHPQDKKMADEILRILRAKGHAIEPEKFRSWAIRNGWKPDSAQQLADVAMKIAKLKNKPSLAKIHDPHARYERWKEKS